MNKEKLKEKFCMMNGWEKVEGYRMDVSHIDSDWEQYYLSKEEAEDMLEETTFWQYTEAMENVYEDIDDVVDYIEDHIDVDFGDFMKKESGGKGK